jgi:carbon starvation protein
VLPVWILLQPRDYLSSFLLYASVAAGIIGLVFGRFPINFPALTGFYSAGVGPLFPFLFVTVACGAISGFHALVASGTTSKQINKESDAKVIGYGAMLVEGLVAIIALATVMMLTKGSALTGKPPLVIYGEGMEKFFQLFHFPARFGYHFGLLALSTFILTTLDTASRLGRYIFQEFFDLNITKTRYWATLATLVAPLFLIMVTLTGPNGKVIPAWQIIWPVFGATNQLLAALTLLVIAVWLDRTKKRSWFVVMPMIFMLVTSVWALVLLIMQYKLSLVSLIAVTLLGLAIWLVTEAFFIHQHAR